MFCTNTLDVDHVQVYKVSLLSLSLNHKHFGHTLANCKDHNSAKTKLTGMNKMSCTGTLDSVYEVSLKFIQTVVICATNMLDIF